MLGALKHRNQRRIAEILERAVADEAAEAVDMRPTLGAHFTSTHLVASRQGHLVSIQGDLTATGMSAGDTVFDLPLSFEPEAAVVLIIQKADGSALAGLDIEPETGVATWRFGTAGTYTLAGLTLIDPWGNR